VKSYARIHDGIVMEIITPAADASGNEIPIADRFHPLLVATMVDITSASPQPQQGWVAVEGGGAWTFSAPASQ
jgi:hypothetical protein